MLEHMIGLDVYSMEWDWLSRQMKTYPHNMALDFSGFDKTITGEMLMYVWKVIEATCRRAGYEMTF